MHPVQEQQPQHSPNREQQKCAINAQKHNYH
jgi:hypothetical protein